MMQFSLVNMEQHFGGTCALYLNSKRVKWEGKMVRCYGRETSNGGWELMAKMGVVIFLQDMIIYLPD